MNKPHARMTAKNAISGSLEDLTDAVPATVQVHLPWTYRLAMLAILGAMTLLWLLILVDWFMGLWRAAPGPGAGRL